MKTTRIHFEDLSCIDFFATESQMAEFKVWLRFAGQDEMFTLPGTEQKIRRRDITRIESFEE